MDNISIVLQDNLEFLKRTRNDCISLIYIDPPFNTKKTQKRNRIKTSSSDKGLVGFGGATYQREVVGQYGSFNDSFDDLGEFLKPRLFEAWRVLKPNGSIYVHLNYLEVHYVKIIMDEIFGRDNFINEIIWCHEYGAKSKSRWSAKHDNILYYAKNHKDYIFNYDKVPRVPYMSPELAGPEKAAKGKTVCDWWRETIVPTNSKEKQNYATQKPLRILNRIVEVSSNPDDLCMDFFAGS